MYGVSLLVVIFMISSYFGVTSYWWLLWGSLIGLGGELVVRFGKMEAAGAILDVVLAILEIMGCIAGRD